MLTLAVLHAVLTLATSTVDDADLRELQRMERRMGDMESQLTKLEAENAQMRRTLQQREERREERRRRLSEAPSCCRATPERRVRRVRHSDVLIVA